MVPGGPFGGHSALPLTAREFWPTLGLPICDSQGGTLCWNGATGVSLHTTTEKRVGLGGLGGSVVSWENAPNLTMALARTHTSQSRPHRGRQGPPIAVRPVAAANWRLILQDIHSRWIEAGEEPQVGPRYTGTMGSCGARIPEPLSRQIHNRQHIISLALQATYISDEVRSVHPLVS